MRCMVHYINFITIFRATPKRRKVFVLHALHGTSHKLNNDFLFYRATPKRRKVFVLHALHGIPIKNGLRMPGANRPYYECLHADPAIRLRNSFLGNNFLFKNGFFECRLCSKITFRAGFPMFMH
jgi:hypothetical protein